MCVLERVTLIGLGRMAQSRDIDTHRHCCGGLSQHRQTESEEPKAGEADRKHTVCVTKTTRCTMRACMHTQRASSRRL
jgi:hypothetical protein